MDGITGAGILFDDEHVAAPSRQPACSVHASRSATHHDHIVHQRNRV
jgi:hypothetical protein